jgi:hypothetical protein
MNNMDKNLPCYDEQLFTINYSQPVSTHSFNMTTIDFSTEIAAAPQHQDSSDSSRNFAIHNVTNQIAMQPQQTLPILSYLKFYHFYVNSFYLVTCKIIYQEDYFFEDNDRYSHEFFYQHPNDSSTRYHITCKSLPNSLVENILNDEFCEMNFDVELLSLNQKI